MNIKDLINLAGEEGKVVVLDDSGEVKGIFLVYNEYQKLAAIKPVREEKTKQNIEHVNREILQAQLSDVEVKEKANKNLETIPQTPQPLSNLLTKRAQEIFGDKPFGNGEEPLYDMRAEVVDPNYGKHVQPVVESDNDEEIKPEFDDI